MKSWLLRRLAVRKNVSIGQRFHVGPNTIIWAPRKLTIGDDVYVGKNVTIQVDGFIGSGSLIANNVGLVGRTDHAMREVGVPVRLTTWVGDDPENLSRPLVIEADVWIGFGAVVLSGLHIGRSAVVAAGSVVTKNVPAGTVVAGNPARVVGTRFTSAEALNRHWEDLGIA